MMNSVCVGVLSTNPWVIFLALELYIRYLFSTRHFRPSLNLVNVSSTSKELKDVSTILFDNEIVEEHSAPKTAFSS